MSVAQYPAALSVKKDPEKGPHSLEGGAGRTSSGHRDKLVQQKTLHRLHGQRSAGGRSVRPL